MGIDTESARFLLSARRAGVVFKECLTLGRQHYFLSNKESKKLLMEFGFDPNAFPDLFVAASGNPYSEPFWRVMGVQSLHTMDASDFEGASIVHDMNQPVPEKLQNRFDVVCDVGTLEHIFNFPTAIKNCLEMLKEGGHFIAHTTANNYFGHGFYQFSPELFYRILSRANGFEVQRMVAVEYGPRRRWYDVSDPAKIQGRVNLINPYPVLLFLIARRVKKANLFIQYPQQSDYAAIWAEFSEKGHKSSQVSLFQSKIFGSLKQTILETVPTIARMLEAYRTSSWNKGFSFRNRLSFKPASKSFRLD